MKRVFELNSYPQCKGQAFLMLEHSFCKWSKNRSTGTVWSHFLQSTFKQATWFLILPQLEFLGLQFFIEEIRSLRILIEPHLVLSSLFLKAFFAASLHPDLKLLGFLFLQLRIALWILFPPDVELLGLLLKGQSAWLLLYPYLYHST